MAGDKLQHALEIAHYVGVRHSHKAKAFAREPVGSPLVVSGLLGMRLSVDFDDQPGFGAEEIGDKWSEPDLAAEFAPWS